MIFFHPDTMKSPIIILIGIVQESTKVAEPGNFSDLAPNQNAQTI